MKFELYTVLVPMQNDGGGEWIDPAFRGLFGDVEEAKAWARQWALTHNGTAEVMKCIPVWECYRDIEPKIIGQDVEI